MIFTDWKSLTTFLYKKYIPQPAHFYQNEKSLQSTFRAEKMTLQKHLYTKFSAKRRSQNETQTWLEEQSDELQVCGAFGREPFCSNLSYIKLFYQSHFFWFIFPLQNFVEYLYPIQKFWYYNRNILSKFVAKVQHFI